MCGRVRRVQHTSNRTCGVTKLRKTLHHTWEKSSMSTLTSLVFLSVSGISPLSSATETETPCSPCTRTSTRRSRVPACTTTRRGLSDVVSEAIKLVLCDIEGKEFRRVKLDFRSAVPCPCEELGVTRMEGFRLNIFSTTGDSAAERLGGREGVRDAGRELAARSPPG